MRRNKRDGIHLEFDQELCKQCGLCEYICPEKIIQVNKGNNYANETLNVYITNTEKCTKCLHCAMMCPEIAISTKETSE